MTVVGPGLAFTDAYATAIYVMGLDGLRWLAADPDRADDYAAYAITDDDRAVWTDGMERYLVREGLIRARHLPAIPTEPGTTEERDCLLSRPRRSPGG